jgi:hypothetical protein
VNITYQTAFVDDSGKLEFRNDIYGQDSTILSLLRNDKNKKRDLEAVVAHAQPNYVHPVGNVPGPRYANSDNGSSGMSFFERLFGGPSAGAAPPRPPRGLFDR